MTFTNPLEDPSNYKGKVKAAFVRWRNLTNQPISKRFWDKVTIGNPDQCWPYNGERNKKGYGIFSPHGKHVDRMLAHRMAWKVTHGFIKTGYHICHHCDNPTCCNPKHLFEGTPRDNIQDCIIKGRLNRPRGERHHSSILKASKVIQIRHAKASGMRINRIAILFGVHRATIDDIITRRTWKHVP